MPSSTGQYGNIQGQINSNETAGGVFPLEMWGRMTPFTPKWYLQAVLHLPEHEPLAAHPRVDS
jgi:hypothetical protein